MSQESKKYVTVRLQYLLLLLLLLLGREFAEFVLCDVEMNSASVITGSSSRADEATRQFNFWTHQINSFFVWKFLPSAQLLVAIRQRLN